MASHISFKPVVARRQQRPDGTYNLKIRVTFKRVSRFLSSTVTVPAKDVGKDGVVKGESLLRGYALIRKFHDYIADLNMFSVEDMDVDDVVKYLRGRESGPGRFRLEFFGFAENHVVSKLSPGTAAAYHVALNAFKRFLGRNTIDINEITMTMLQDFMAFIDAEPKQYTFPIKDPHKKPKKKVPGRASAIYTLTLRVVFKKAVYRFNDEDAGIINIPRNPFAKLNLTPKTGVAKIAQTPEAVQRIIDYRGRCTYNQRRAIDVYLLSFALMGMNGQDMIEAASPKNGVVTYYRAKVRERRRDHAEHRILMDERLKPLFDKYRDPDGKRLFCFYKEFDTGQKINRAMRAALHSVAKKIGVAPFSLNAARHTWGTVARSSLCKVDKATVDECLVHLGDHKLVDVYAEKDWKIFWDVNTKVLDVFDWTAISGEM